MKKLSIFITFIIILEACSNNTKAPDVSNIKIELSLERFEKDFFAVDTNNIINSLRQLQSKYPSFFPDFTSNILGLPPLTDTSMAAMTAIKKFIADYRPIKDSADKILGDLRNTEKEIKQSLQFIKFYFPDYALPRKLITFIGPMDAFFEASLGGYGDVVTREGMATGLQLHLGSEFSFYHSQMGESLYPGYISKRFTPQTIAVNCIKNIIDDLYPEQLRGKVLVEQMIEKGKRLYVLDKVMPFAADSLKIGYTGNQIKGCFGNEGRIWNFFVTNSLLLSNEPSLQKNYMADAPTTQELGDGSPGYIGLFVGWQIVKKYMEKNSALTLPQLLQTDAQKIFEESKYRPK
ncbi:MAG: hypothetical protein ACKVOW_12480 [Chitinophagaceae bacterium]